MDEERDDLMRYIIGERLQHDLDPLLHRDGLLPPGRVLTY